MQGEHVLNHTHSFFRFYCSLLADKESQYIGLLTNIVECTPSDDGAPGGYRRAGVVDSQRFFTKTFSAEPVRGNSSAVRQAREPIQAKH